VSERSLDQRLVLFGLVDENPSFSQRLLSTKTSDDTGWEVADSAIHGKGIMATKPYVVGDIVGKALDPSGKDWELTELARFCNHQKHQNSDIKKNADGEFDLVAIKDIDAGDEITSNYEQVTEAIGPDSEMRQDGKPVPVVDTRDYEKEAASRVRVAMPYGKGYLMEKMNNPKYPDNLGKVRFPGGGIDEGETAEEAAVREMREELGITVDPAMLKRLGIYTDGQYGPEQYFSYDNHGLGPGDYEATVGGDKYVELLESGTDNPNFWGSKLDELQKESEYRLEDQTFSDSDGSYNVADLYELAKAKGKPQNLQISDLLHNLEPSPEEEGEELPGHPDFVSRAEAAGDLPGVVVNYPDGKWVADGVHRLWKANRDKKLEFPAYMLEQSDLAGLLQKEAAVGLQGFMDRSELMGSRGRALKYGRPEPEGRDYDRVVFTDDAEDQQALMKNLREVAKVKGYKQHERPDGFLTVSGDNQDLSVYPTSKRDKIYNAWELIEGGMSKDEAWDQIAKEAKDKIEFVHSCCGKPAGECAGCPSGSSLILKDEHESA
jgi:8-oxo-dGTP pyrophosphatase MutT (NUDIX family)